MSTHWCLGHLHQLICVSCVFLQGGVAKFGGSDLSSGGSPPDFALLQVRPNHLCLAAIRFAWSITCSSFFRASILRLLLAR